MIGKVLRCLGQLIFFPQECVICAKWVVNPHFSPLCERCLEEVEGIRVPICQVCGLPLPGNLLEPLAECSRCLRNPYPFDSARSFGTYDGSLRTSIRSFKFKRMRRLAAPLGRFLEDAFNRYFQAGDIDILVPVLLHYLRLRERGFDQAALLARELSERIAIPVHSGLIRLRNTAPQVGLSAAHRVRNLTGAFRLSCPEELRGRRVLVIDDVMTTGTTVCEIVKLLRRGAKPGSVRILTVARVSKTVLV